MRGAARWWRYAAGFLLFALAFAIANRFQLVQAVLYRLAADDWISAAAHFAILAMQAAALLGALLLLPRWGVRLAVLLAGVSILVNLGFGETVGALLDPGKLAWLVSETRQAGNAAGEFAGPLLWAGLQTAIAIALFLAARRLTGTPVGPRPATGFLLLLAPSALLALLSWFPAGAERNIYSLGLAVATADPPPVRAPVTLRPDMRDAPRHIVWLIDESIAAGPFARLVAPDIARLKPVNFGIAASMGHCSAPSNVALRSGVDVRRVDVSTDLRATSSIWAYARKAGYRTILIDGQAQGAPQNLLLPPERALIDDYRSMAGDIDTDRRIARAINRELRTPGRSFVYALLRGVHFQYRDHYPPGMIPHHAPKLRHYETALSYSKRDFFATLLDGVDRDRTAIVYLSDHGQNFADNRLAHCSRAPVEDEFRIPLIAFLPERLAGRYRAAMDAGTRGGRSASQVFPATLGWMGYDRARVAAAYDHDLDRPTARYVWFDRDVVPLGKGDMIGVTAGEGFPGAAR